MNYLPPLPPEPPIMARLTTLATATPPLAEQLRLIAEDVAKAHTFHWLGTDSRLRLAWTAIERLCQVAQYQQERYDALALEVAWLRESRERP